MSRLPTPRSYRRAEAVDLIGRGSLPDLRDLTDQDRTNRCAAYVHTIIEHDLVAVHAVRKSVRRIVVDRQDQSGS